jgi:hypothetical protein
LPLAGLLWWAQSTPATDGDLHDQGKIDHDAVRSNCAFKTKQVDGSERQATRGN